MIVERLPLLKSHNRDRKIGIIMTPCNRPRKQRLREVQLFTKFAQLRFEPGSVTFTVCVVLELCLGQRLLTSDR